MKPFNAIKRLGVLGAVCSALWAAPASAQEEIFEPRTSVATGESDDRTLWGWEVGGVFTHIPISQALDSGFAVLMGHVYYSRLLNNPDDFIRTAASLGLYGFQIILPVPKASVDLFVGKPTDDLQFKGSVGAFYDITVGGHGGLALGLGTLIRNRINVSFFTVPFGVDAKRDYLYMTGQREEEHACTSKEPCVETPYFGLFVGLQY